MFTKDDMHHREWDVEGMISQESREIVSYIKVDKDNHTAMVFLKDVANDYLEPEREVIRLIVSLLQDVGAESFEYDRDHNVMKLSWD
jgi:hypothetical protein